MAKKWYEVDMNNSRNQAMLGKQMREDLKNAYLKLYPPPCGETFESGWFIVNTYIHQGGENFEEGWE